MSVTVTYEEMQGSPQEQNSKTGGTATRQLICAWGDRWTLMQEIIDEAYENLDPSSLIAINATSTPMLGANTGSGTVATYEKAIVSVEYTTPKFEEDEGGDEKTESIEPYAEFLTVGSRNLRWTDTNGSPLVKDETPGILMQGLVYVFRKNFQTDLPDSVRELIGKVNVAAITPTSTGMEGFVFEAETLLFQPPSIVRTFDSDNNLTWDVEYRFMYKPNWDGTTARGWNYFWNQNKTGGAGFDKIYDVKAGGQYKHYLLGDFTTV